MVYFGALCAKVPVIFDHIMFLFTVKYSAVVIGATHRLKKKKPLHILNLTNFRLGEY